MEPSQWLTSKSHGFSKLEPRERVALADFTLLWSLFEARALRTQASSHGILALTHEWAATGKLELARFDPSLTYFTKRFYSGTDFTQHFNGLKLRSNDCKALVEQVLTGKNESPADRIAVLLIVVFRLRNNFFHGLKWADSLRGQFENFQNANNALMAALEIVGVE